jgi:hypothetical protein
MRTTTSPAAALKVSAPAKTNPINRLKTITPLLFSAPNCQPSSSPSEGVIENQQDHRADNRHEETIEVESAYARGSKDVEQPATGKSADNTQQDVEQDALTCPIYNLAADEPRNQAENYPGQKRHSLSLLSRQ